MALGIVCLCAVSQGNELTELIASLQQLEGVNAVNVDVHIESVDAAKSKTAQHLNAVVCVDANTMRLTVAKGSLKSRLLSELSLTRAVELLNYGPCLADDLNGLTLTKKSAAQYLGEPCQKWYLEANKKKSSFGIKASRKQTMNLWVDAQGYPLKADMKTVTVAGIAFVKQTSESRREQRYQRIGDRLVLNYDDEETMVKHGKKGGYTQQLTTTVTERMEVSMQALATPSTLSVFPAK